MQRLRVKALLLIPEAISVAKILELSGNDLLEGLTYHGAFCMTLRQSARPQINLVNAPKGLCEGDDGTLVTRDLVEITIGRKSKCLTCLIQRWQSKIVSALDIDGGEVHGYR